MAAACRATGGVMFSHFNDSQAATACYIVTPRVSITSQIVPVRVQSKVRFSVLIPQRALAKDRQNALLGV